MNRAALSSGLSRAAAASRPSLASGTEAKPSPAAPWRTPTVDVLVAKSDIGIGQWSSRTLQWQTWPSATASSSFIRRASKAGRHKGHHGSIARTPSSPASRSANRSWSGRRLGLHGRDPAAGMRAVSTEISPETGAGGFILPNDRVDVVLTRRDKNPDSKRRGRRYLGNHPDQCSRSRDRSGAEGKGRHKTRWSARPLRSN